MKRTAGILVTLLVGVVAAQLFADVSIENRGCHWALERVPAVGASKDTSGWVVGGVS